MLVTSGGETKVGMLNGDRLGFISTGESFEGVFFEEEEEGRDEGIMLSGIVSRFGGK